LLIDGRDANS